jgi:hypothetical protein
LNPIHAQSEVRSVLFIVGSSPIRRNENNHIELRYEDLVESPEATLRRLLEFLGEPWDPGVLNYHHQKRNLEGESSATQVSEPLYKSAVGRWKRDLKSGDKEVVKRVAGTLLIELGYAKDFR